MNILETIIAKKRNEVAQRRSVHSLEELIRENASKSKRYSLFKYLTMPGRTGIIAEFKRRSPSKGDINITAEVKDVTAAYASGGASAISILTDGSFFGGTFADLRDARFNQIPLLQKDFIIEEYQLAEAKANGADAILLIAACLSKEEVRSLAKKAIDHDLEVLLELHDESELDHITDETKIIGINNRNLKDFKVDIERSMRLAEKLPAGKLKVAESGIDSPEIIRKLRSNGYHGFLIGEYFMKKQDPGAAFHDFVKQLA